MHDAQQMPVHINLQPKIATVGLTLNKRGPSHNITIPTVYTMSPPA